MYAAYALSALMTPNSPVDGLLAAGVMPALVGVLNTSRVRLTRARWGAQWVGKCKLEPDSPRSRGQLESNYNSSTQQS